MKKDYLTFTFLFFIYTALGQYQIGLVPRNSPDKGVFHKIGFTEIEIKYGSPKVKGRSIWGDLLPFEKVWRAGANEATTIAFDQDIFINEKSLPKGKYSIFIIPKKNDKWIMIFNTIHKQWGAFGYDESKDALRIEILPLQNDFHESLQYSIKQNGPNYGHLFLEWDHIKLVAEIKTDYLKIFKNKLLAKIEEVDSNLRWVVYLQGAEFLMKENKELDLALDWVNKSEESYPTNNKWNPQFYPKNYILGHLYWTTAKIYSQREEFPQALEYVKKMKDLKKEKYNFYQRKNEDLNIDKQIQDWQNQK